MSEVRELLDEKKNPFWRHARRWLFVAWRGSGGAEWPVGRIAAITDENFNRHQNMEAGLFGFFECEPDPRTAEALVTIARTRLRGEGAQRMIGPTSPSTNDECGLLVQGHDLPPVLMMPYNPGYYPELLERQGFRKGWDLLAWRFDAARPLPERMARIVARLSRSGRVRLRPIVLSRFQEELRRVREVYNAAWDRNHAFVPMTEEEMTYAAGKLKAMLPPAGVLFAEVDGQLAGMGLVLWDINPLLREFNGRMGPLQVLRFLTSRPRWMRLVALGVKPEFRRIGVEALLYVRMLEEGRRAGVIGAELSWTLEDNREINQGIQAMGGERYKTYRLYEMPI